MNRTLRVLPVYLTLIAANALPVYGAAIGKLVLFQVLFLYWFESLLLVAADCIRIAAARGNQTGGSLFHKLSLRNTNEYAGVQGFWPKLALVLGTLFGRVLLLLFYLVFLVLFIGFQVTGEGHERDVMRTMVLQDPFFNTSLAIFGISTVVQLIGFFISGNYRTDSPRKYAGLFDVRSVLIHVMIAGSVFMHRFLFEGKSYEAAGEIAYIGIFMLIKTFIELRSLHEEGSEARESMPMI